MLLVCLVHRIYVGSSLESPSLIRADTAESPVDQLVLRIAGAVGRHTADLEAAVGLGVGLRIAEEALLGEVRHPIKI